jgi:MFS family permease
MAQPLVTRLVPIAAVIFITFFVVGLAMPVLPLHINQRLGLGAFVVGLVSGSQFTAALIARIWAGQFADRRGAKRAVILGLAMAAAAGLVYLLSLQLLGTPAESAAVLLLGRFVLGAGESAVITGSLSWALGLGGPKDAGLIMAWLGLPMYAAFALGAPAGSALYAHYGFVAVGLATLLAPLLGLLLVAPLRALPPSGRSRLPYASVFAAVALPGLGLALSSAGFGAITIFVVLLFAARGWGSAWLAFTALSVAFILARLVAGHLPDRLGGAKVALASLALEAAGQGMIWLAPSPLAVFAGSALTGFGYSLVFPSFGVEAVQRAPSGSRGLVLGAYTACLDLALGLAGPCFGILADRAGPGAVFLASTVVVAAAALIAARFLQPRAALAPSAS